jgi:hypothetical protein
MIRFFSCDFLEKLMLLKINKLSKMNICFMTIVVFTKYYFANRTKNKIMSLFFCKEHRKLAKTQRKWLDVVENLALILEK